MTTRRTMLVAALGGVILAAASLLWADDKSAADKRADQLLLEMKLQTLLTERVASAMLGAEATQHAYNSGTVTLAQLIQSRKDLAEARYAVATTAAEREAALQEIVTGYRMLEEKVTRLNKDGIRGGEHSQLSMVTVARQTAEIRLLEEQLRSTAEKPKPMRY